MQRNIDSFFKKLTPAAAPKSTAAPAAKKRKARIIASDDEDEQQQQQQQQQELKPNTPQIKKQRQQSPAPKQPATPKQKVNPQTLFAVEPKRIEQIKPKDAATIKASAEMADDEIDQSLLDIDLDETVSANKMKQQKQNGSSSNSTTAANDSKPLVANKATTKKAVKQDLESSVMSDEERQDRKRMVAMLYQKRQNRPSCLNPGSKEVPKGAPHCLAGLTFLITGVLESLEREEAASIIKEYGGKVNSTVGKRLNYMIVGEDAGPKKLAQAEEYGINVISEDAFFDLIREKSQPKAVNGNAHKVKTEQASTSQKSKQRDASITPPEKRRKLAEQTTTSTTTTVSLKQEQVSPIKQALTKSEELQQKPIKIEAAETKEPALLSWVDKYKPTSIKEIVGQQGATGNVTKLMNWLSKWYSNHDGKKKLQKPNPWAKNDDGSYFKAALLSGPPGIGKTTTATLVAKELGFDAVEFNASDTRSKRLLKEQVSELLSNKSLHGFCHGQAQAVTKKHVLIMDEVDGMAGNEDRGGIQELIALIKDASVPIICMCNDRNHQKMRSLVNYCYDLRFNKPRLEQMKGRVLSICARERFKVDTAKVEEIITATNYDLRQTINHLNMLSAGKDLQLKSTGVDGKTAHKDMKMGPWEVIRKVFSADEHKHMSFNDKSDLFFHDYSLGPLFVQQNYLQVTPAAPKSEWLQRVALTADSLSLGDLVDKRIRSNAAWSLLPSMAVFSSVLPGEYMSGYFTGQPNFPGWLGKNSRANKRSRLAQEIHDHTRLRTSGSRLSIRLDYAPFLLSAICKPLQLYGQEGVSQALDVIKEYHLLREDIDALIELSSWPGKKNPMDGIDGRVKAALTRAYNKEVMPYTYSAQAQIKKKKAENIEDAEMLDLEEGQEDNAVLDSDEEKDDDVENDALIKTKKKPSTSTAASTSKSTKSSSAGTSKKSSKANDKPKASTSKSKK